MPQVTLSSPRSWLIQAVQIKVEAICVALTRDALLSGRHEVFGLSECSREPENSPQRIEPEGFLSHKNVCLSWVALSPKTGGSA